LSAAEISRGILGFEIAPPLKRPARIRSRPNNFRIEQDITATAPFPVRFGLQRHDGLATPYSPSDDPIQRTCADDLVSPSRHHAGPVNVEPVRTPQSLCPTLRTPVDQFVHRSYADTEFDDVHELPFVEKKGTTMFSWRPYMFIPLLAKQPDHLERDHAPAMTDTTKPSETRQTKVQLAARQHTALDWLRMHAPCFVKPLGSAVTPHPPVTSH
jgi:hypothetical protein